MESCGVKSALDAFQRIGLAHGYLVRVSCFRRLLQAGGRLGGGCLFRSGFRKRGFCRGGFAGFSPSLLYRLGLGVVGAYAQALSQLRQGFGGVGAALQADSQIEVVISLIWVDGLCLAEERNAVLASAGQRDALIVENLSEGQHASHAGKCLLSVRVVAGKQQRESAEETGFEGIVGSGAVAAHFSKSRCRLLVLLARVVLASQRHPGRREPRAEHDRLIQMAQAFLLVTLGDTANVLLKGGKVQSGAGGHKSLFGNFEAGVELPRKLPGQRAEDRNQIAHLASGGNRCAHAQMGHVHQLGLGHNARAVGHVAAHDDRICVQRLGQLERTGARGVKALRQPQVVQRIHAVRAAHGSKARRGQSAAQNLRGGFANPLQAGLAGAVVKGQNQQYAAVFRCGGFGFRGALRAGANRDAKGQRSTKPKNGGQF